MSHKEQWKKRKEKKTSSLVERRRKAIKIFFHCSQCVTNFHYGFRAININKRISKKLGKEIRKSNFCSSQACGNDFKTAINCNRSNGGAQSTLHYLKLMRLLWHERSKRKKIYSMAFIAFGTDFLLPFLKIFLYLIHEKFALKCTRGRKKVERRFKLNSLQFSYSLFL